MSKIKLCTQICQDNPNADRQELITLFMAQVPGITYAGASTYASTVKKTFLADAPARAMIMAREEETDNEIAIRLEERFLVIDTLAAASCHSQILSLIISGPAGLGKSFTTEKAVKEYDPEGDKTIIAKGTVRATGLYQLLHEYRRKGCVIVLDDADSIFNDPDALNILKAACDTTEERWIDWRSETKMVDVDGEPIDRTFHYQGTLIFITNKDFDAEMSKGGKNAEHYEALISRSHYVECDMHHIRDYIIRIKQVVEMGMLRDQRNMTVEESDMIVRFIEENSHRLRELTLRMALKLADVYKLDPDNFHSLAKVSCFKRQSPKWNDGLI